MAEYTSIEWCDATLNLWVGCTKVSSGCQHCYAESLRTRFGHSNWGPTGIRQEVKSWRSTLAKISKRAKSEGRRLRVFCQSMSDTFEGPETMGGRESENWKTVSGLQTLLLQAIGEHPELDFLILTKRPENVQWIIAEHNEVSARCDKPAFEWPKNAWLGTSVENQQTAGKRIPLLQEIPAKVRFLSCEPLLGPLNIESYIRCEFCNYAHADDRIHWDHHLCRVRGGKIPPEIHWVICGGESGPGARPMHPNWARSLRDQCASAGVPFFFKQWGEWAPDEDLPSNFDKNYLRTGISREYVDLHGQFDALGISPSIRVLNRVGKKRAGRMLDGREWSQFPEVR